MLTLSKVTGLAYEMDMAFKTNIIQNAVFHDILKGKNCSKQHFGQHFESALSLTAYYEESPHWCKFIFIKSTKRIPGTNSNFDCGTYMSGTLL